MRRAIADRPDAPHGIPTTYRGTTFRSRLEATWAAFFDLMGWRWAYEGDPVGDWLPDFRLHAPGAPEGVLLCEIKPTWERPGVRDTDCPYRKMFCRTAGHPDSAEGLALGLAPFAYRTPPCAYDGAPTLAVGWLHQWTEGDGSGGPVWLPALLTRLSGDGPVCGLTTEEDVRYPRTDGLERLTGGRYPLDDKPAFPPGDFVDRAWGAATGAVRWRPAFAREPR